MRLKSLTRENASLTNSTVAKKKGGNDEHSLPYVYALTQELPFSASSAQLLSQIYIKV